MLSGLSLHFQQKTIHDAGSNPRWGRKILQDITEVLSLLHNASTCRIHSTASTLATVHLLWHLLGGSAIEPGGVRTRHNASTLSTCVSWSFSLGEQLVTSIRRSDRKGGCEIGRIWGDVTKQALAWSPHNNMRQPISTYSNPRTNQYPLGNRLLDDLA